MKNQMIVVLAVVGAMALGAQTYTILQLTAQINQLSVRIEPSRQPSDGNTDAFQAGSSKTGLQQQLLRRPYGILLKIYNVHPLLTRHL